MNNTADVVTVQVSKDAFEYMNAIAERVIRKELTVNREKLTKLNLRTPQMRVSKFVTLFCEMLEARLDATEKRNAVNSMIKMLSSPHVSQDEKNRIIAKLTGNDGEAVDLSLEDSEAVA